MPPPRDSDLRTRIEKLSAYVSQSGSNVDMEATLRERQRGNPQFAFLFGGEGADYYAECKLRARSNMGGGMGGGAPPNQYGGGGGYGACGSGDCGSRGVGVGGSGGPAVGGGMGGAGGGYGGGS